jgi:hypothetical protein
MDMPSVSPHRVTQLLEQWSHGDDAALAELTPLVYEELRRFADRDIHSDLPKLPPNRTCTLEFPRFALTITLITLEMDSSA